MDHTPADHGLNIPAACTGCDITNATVRVSKVVLDRILLTLGSTAEVLEELGSPENAMALDTLASDLRDDVFMNRRND